jgi:CRISPR/Cas system-associated protein Cas10 (large subunit of type III CRISPR-Cas system)
MTNDKFIQPDDGNVKFEPTPEQVREKLRTLRAEVHARKARGGFSVVMKTCEICGDKVLRLEKAECGHIVRLCETCKAECSGALRACIKCEDKGR